jgi:hypothetical protein
MVGCGVEHAVHHVRVGDHLVVDGFFSGGGVFDDRGGEVGRGKARRGEVGGVEGAVDDVELSQMPLWLIQ